MSPDQKRAKELYIKGKKPSEIAEELELSIGTVYRWISKESLVLFEEHIRLWSIYEIQQMAALNLF